MGNAPLPCRSRREERGTRRSLGLHRRLRFHPGLAKRDLLRDLAALQAVVADGDLAVPLDQEEERAGGDAVDAGHHEALGAVGLDLDLVEEWIVDDAARDHLAAGDG